MPDGLEYRIVVDTNDFVIESIKEVVSTLVEAMILVFIVVYVFLQNWRATLIPCIAVPVSIIGTFAGLYAFGYTLNTLTLFAMVLAIGIVVDDAIVVLENVERIMSTEHLPPKEATAKAMNEVTAPVIAIVLVLCAVFIPVSFMGGLAGQMYKQFANHHFGFRGALGHCGPDAHSGALRSAAQASFARLQAGQVLHLVQLRLRPRHSPLRAHCALHQRFQFTGSDALCNHDRGHALAAQGGARRPRAQ